VLPVETPHVAAPGGSGAAGAAVIAGSLAADALDHPAALRAILGYHARKQPTMCYTMRAFSHHGEPAQRETTYTAASYAVEALRPTETAVVLATSNSTSHSEKAAAFATATQRRYTVTGVPPRSVGADQCHVSSSGPAAEATTSSGGDGAMADVVFTSLVHALWLLHPPTLALAT